MSPVIAAWSRGRQRCVDNRIRRIAWARPRRPREVPITSDRLIPSTSGMMW